MNKPFNAHFKDYNFSKEKIKESFTDIDFLLKINNIEDSFFHEKIEKESKDYLNNGYPKESYDHYYHLMPSENEISIILFIIECHLRRYHDDNYWGRQYDNGFFIKKDYKYTIKIFSIDDFKYKKTDIFIKLMEHYKNNLLGNVYKNNITIEDIILNLEKRNIKLEKEMNIIKSILNDLNQQISKF
jgi:hypothetical protein